MRPFVFLLACLLGGLAGCATLGSMDDGTSVARGSSSNGRLSRPVRLPVVGDGYRVPPTWAKRGLSYGTDELVSLIVRSARRVHLELPGVDLFVADLALARGGASKWHRSHQTGRDADILFYATLPDGRPAPPPSEMPRFGADGRALGGTLVFDTARNWALVRAILEDPVVDVQFLFIYAPLKEKLLAHARAQGVPEELIARANAVLHQPGDSLPHDDHLHLRVYCAPSDRELGCRDSGPLRWFKKGYKYLVDRSLTAVFTVPPVLKAFAARPFCRMGIVRPDLVAGR